ncbi:ubiquinol-cytochrome c reductase iron-sulfur subunit [Ralstonia solanacearum]|uniref:ubiquinol-cytochrome c reductase iron-sulfur subunit n=1 Tax=Ralstonia solanacearum TaxID=305 RepID=UPI001F09CA41|nr:ubiquinol-cytochrome c reductase iron-sulfur subunit [Ralstonia solanacearum]
MKVVEWRGKPVWLLKRTPRCWRPQEDRHRSRRSQVRRALHHEDAGLLQERNPLPRRTPDLLVVVGICSHLGCSPSGPFVSGANAQLGADPGFVCPCHGSTFDLAGRVFKNKPAPQNLDVPPYMFLSDTSC